MEPQPRPGDVSPSLCGACHGRLAWHRDRQVSFEYWFGVCRCERSTRLLQLRVPVEARP